MGKAPKMKAPTFPMMQLMHIFKICFVFIYVKLIFSADVTVTSSVFDF